MLRFSSIVGLQIEILLNFVFIPYNLQFLSCNISNSSTRGGSSSFVARGGFSSRGATFGARSGFRSRGTNPSTRGTYTSSRGTSSSTRGTYALGRGTLTRGTFASSRGGSSSYRRNGSSPRGSYTSSRAGYSSRGSPRGAGSYRYGGGGAAGGPPGGYKESYVKYPPRDYPPTRWVLSTSR